jgi:3'-phosphoadenosine 5'-phosphosulfate sulfotransferase (PAPS reductase)/FAD synthetase
MCRSQVFGARGECLPENRQQFAANETKNPQKQKCTSSLQLSAISLLFNSLRGEWERNAMIAGTKKDQKRRRETVKALSAGP